VELGGHIEQSEVEPRQIALMEELLNLVVTVVSYTPADLQSKIRIHIVHQLAVSGTCQFSQIHSSCEEQLGEELPAKLVEELLSDVARFVQCVDGHRQIV